MEQIIFGMIFSVLPVRIISFSLSILIIDIVFAGLFVKHRKKISLPGYLILSGFIFQFFAFLLRIPFALFTPDKELIFNIGGIQSLLIALCSFISTTWTIGFTLLISYRLQQKESAQNLEKTALLQELYHRTNNNMQVISAFISLQQQKNESIEMKNQFQTIIDRIYSISLVHKKLYQAKSLSSLNLKEYLLDLMDSLMESYNVDSYNIILKQNIEDVIVLIDIAVPIGLVINELVSNIFKHAFPEGKGIINIDVHKNGINGICITVKDNGIGFPADYDFNDINTLGLQTSVNIIEKQLAGKIRFESSDGSGCYIEFENISYATKI
jgi:two-component sensor histidine kinase